MKFSTKLFLLLFLIAAVLFGITFYIFRHTDRTSPTITFPQDDSFVFKNTDDESRLFEGVIAKDAQDGDVSESLRITKKFASSDGETMSVTYACKDSNNNVCKATRVVNYETDEVPVSVAYDANFIATANDAGVKATSMDIDALPAESPKIWLSAYAVEVPLGSEFNANSYISAVADDDTDNNNLLSNLEVSGKVDTSVEGCYHEIYRVIDRFQNPSNIAVLTVIVK